MTVSEAKVVVVTGGASGIGQATVTNLLSKGWRVAILDLETPALDDARSAHQGNADTFVAAIDVTDEDAVNKTIGEIENDFGPIHAVVNSAGIAADHHVTRNRWQGNGLRWNRAAICRRD